MPQEMTKNTPREIEYVLSDIMSAFREFSQDALAEKRYTLIAEVIRVSSYGEDWYADTAVFGNHIQLIIPMDLMSEIVPDYEYECECSVEIPKQLRFGLIQLRVHSIRMHGQGRRVALRNETIAFIKKHKYMERLRFDFAELAGRPSYRIAIVTAPQSQALVDVQYELKLDRRVEWEQVDVQMAEPKSIADGIRLAAGGNFDAILLIRSGGDEKNLAIFDTVPVIEAIGSAAVPTLVALSHSKKNTFADLVADHAETTPTRAAQFFLEAIRTESTPDIAHKRYNRHAYLNRLDRRPKLQPRFTRVAVGVVLLALVIVIVVLLAQK